MKYLFCSLAFFLFSIPGFTQTGLDYYLPDGVELDASIPTPSEVLNMEVGEWHVRHDQLVQYMYAVAEASERISITEYGRSYENRALLSLVITSPENHERLEEIREQHVMLSDPERSGDLDVSAMPVVVQLSYSVHGNEPSGANSSLLTVYYLAAAQGADIDEMLENTVVLVDPSINPDGLNRFAHWANMHRSKNVLVTDPESREFNEVWPGGRTNHYWFDLNRDWLLVQHPESKGRIARFQEWKPNIQTDHHEMGTNSTFFFQPGIPSRTHPLTPQRNQDLTGNIAEYHADALDQIQSLYYSKESFDDFYYGKGSTYPDVQGSIGILFEQASSRGHAQESVHGILRFPFTIRNQFTASLSTLEAAQALREELLEHQRLFYQESAEMAKESKIKAWVFGETADRARSWHLAEMLSRHQIQVYELDKSMEASGEQFIEGKAYVVPADQPQYRLIKAVFERRTTFTDSLFYDVSAWTMPYAFNLPFAELNARQFDSSLLGKNIDNVWESPGKMIGSRAAYAYVFEWDEYYAPRALYKLQKAGIRTKVASRPFSAVTRDGNTNFDYGTILIPLGVQDDQELVHEMVRELTKSDGVDVFALSTGLSSSGIDLGSRNFEDLTMPSVAMVGGSGTNSYEVGESWHLFDQRYHMPLSIIDMDDMGGADLSRYNVLVMTGYNYSSLSSNTVEEIKRWIRRGGTLITYKQGIYFATQNGLADVEFISDEEEGETETRPYVKQGMDRGAGVIGGAIFNTRIDLTHPLGYGFNDDELTVFRNSTIFMEKGENPYSTPVYYTSEPLASGYISDENVDMLANSAAVIVHGYGRGKVITMTDNPNFRAFWYGTNKLFMNAVFFGQTISGGTAN